MDLAATSTEYVHLNVVAAISGTPISLATPPKMAALATSANPIVGDWFDAEWSGGYARLLIGPAGGAVTLDVGLYNVWITFAAGLETPVYRAGTLTVY